MTSIIGNHVQWFAIFCLCLLSTSGGYGVEAFMTQSSITTTKKPSLLVLNKKFRNKQAEMAKKMELAKQQRREQQEGGEETSSMGKTSDEKKKKLTSSEIKEKNDRLRFEQLLKTQSSNVLNDYSSDGYLNKQQEEEEISAARAGVDRLFEGDPAPSEPFEELVNIQTGNALGMNGAKRVVPWLRNSNPTDYLIIICDPRMKSPELRQAVTSVRGELKQPMKSRLIIINADTPAENRRWVKKSSIGNDTTIYSDEKMEWMRNYSALGGKRYSMTMFIIADARCQKIVRDLDPYSVARVVTNAVKSMQETRSI